MQHKQLDKNEVSNIAAQESSSSDEDNCSFSLGNSLAAFFPLLEEIFTYLDDRSVQVAVLVNSDWEAVAKRLLQKRQLFSWITLKKTKTQSCLTVSNNFIFSNPSLVIIAVSERLQLKGMDLVCLHNSRVCSSFSCKCLFLFFCQDSLFVFF